MILAYNGNNDDNNIFLEILFGTAIPLLLISCASLILGRFSVLYDLIADGELVTISFACNLATLIYFVTQNVYSKYTSKHFFGLLFLFCITLWLTMLIKFSSTEPGNIVFISLACLVATLITDCQVLKRINLFKEQHNIIKSSSSRKHQ